MKKIISISVILFFLILGSVSAQDIENTTSADGTDEILEVENVKTDSDFESIDSSDFSSTQNPSSELGYSEDNNVLGSPHIRIYKESLDNFVQIGDDVYFKIFVQNNGQSSYNGQIITINDWADEGLEYVDYTPNPDSNGNIFESNYTFVGIVEDETGKHLQVNYTTGDDFLPYDSFSFTTHYKAVKTGSIKNIAQIRWKNNVWDTTSHLVRYEITVNVVNPSLNITKTPRRPEAGLNDDVYFDIFIENNGDYPYYGDYLYINDWFDDKLEYVDYTVNPDKNGNIWAQNYAYVGMIEEGQDPYGKRLLVMYRTYGSWEPGSTINFTVHFKAKDYGVLNNSAQIFWKWKDWGDDESHRWIEVWGNSSVLVAEPKFSVEKTAVSENVSVGDSINFTVTVKNTGERTLTGVYIKDEEYSEGLEFLDYSDKQSWEFDGNHTWYYKGILKANESASLILVFKALTFGIKNNTAVAGHNLTNKTLNSTSYVNVVENKPQNNTTNHENKPNKENKNNTITPKNQTDNKNKNSTAPGNQTNKYSDKNKANNYTKKSSGKTHYPIELQKSGNPIIVLLFVLILLPYISKKQ